MRQCNKESEPVGLVESINVHCAKSENSDMKLVKANQQVQTTWLCLDQKKKDELAAKPTISWAKHRSGSDWPPPPVHVSQYTDYLFVLTIEHSTEY